jgi:hypothetical protein
VAEVWLVVVVSVIGVACVVGLLSALRSPRPYSEVGQGPFFVEQSSSNTPPDPNEAETEIRQLLEAKSALRQSRGQPPLDVEQQVKALVAEANQQDPGLREEIEQLVTARNERRKARGEKPLDVEAEIARQLDSIREAHNKR